MKHLALLTLYADYQVLPAKERARDIYLYFSSSAFTKLHLEEMFHVGREELEETEQFWEDWIDLLKAKKWRYRSQTSERSRFVLQRDRWPA